MSEVMFTEGAGLQDSIFGKSQAPIRMLIEKHGEAFEAKSGLIKIFNTMKSGHFGEKFTSLVGMNGFMPVGENGQQPDDSTREGYSKFLEHMTWKDSFSLSREIVEDSKAIDLAKEPRIFADGYYRTREQFGAALLGAAVSGKTSVNFKGKTFDATCADGKGLFATDHPSITGGAAQSNCFSDAFSSDALAALECAMQDFRGDNGEILDVAPDTIIIPNDYALKKAVFADIGSDVDADGVGFNYTYGRWNVIVWPYLNQFIEGDSKPWILFDSRYNQLYGGAVWLDRTPLEIKSRIDDVTDANVWSGYARFIAGFNDWRAFAVGGISGGEKLLG